MRNRVDRPMFSRGSVAVVSTAVVVSVLTGVPAQAAKFDVDRKPKLQSVKMVKSSKNANKRDGKASAAAAAIAKAAKSRKPVEIIAARTELDTFFANPDGSITQDTTVSPVRVKSKDGELSPIDLALRQKQDRLAPVSSPIATTLSGDGTGQLGEVSLGQGRKIGLTMSDVTLGSPTVSDAAATYRISGTAAPGTVQVRATSTGLATHVVLDRAPTDAPEYVFDIDAAGLTPSLNKGVLAFTTKNGDVVAKSAPLRMWDADVDAAGFPTSTAPVDAKLSKSGDRWRLVLQPSMEYLTAPTTSYPVVVDPDISADAGNHTFFSSGANANTDYRGQSYINVGFDGTQQNWGFLAFKYNSFFGSTVTNASLKLWQFQAPSCAAATSNFSPMNGGDGSSSNTWATKPSRDTDARWKATLTGNAGATGCAAAQQTADVTSIVNGWAGQHVGTHTDGGTVYDGRQAIIMEPADETSPAQFKRFCSDVTSAGTACDSATKQPVLSVTYAPELGSQSWYSTTDRELGDRAKLSVNNKNGNLFYSGSDIKINGIGLDLKIDRTYNSQSQETGTLGPQWGLTVGPDVWLEKLSTYRYDFHAPGGTVLGSFVRKSSDPASADYKKFHAPVGGVGAELEESSTGSTMTLTFRKSQSKYVFGQANTDGDLFMRYLRDRSDNEIQVTYSGTAGDKPKIASIIDSSGRTYTPTYTSNVITKIENGGGTGQRSWAFAYTSGMLSGSSNALGPTTNYEYTTAAGASRLSKIIQPTNQSLTAPTTEITYAADQVGTVGYRLNDTATGLLKYSFAYGTGSTSRPGDCPNAASFFTTVTDPRSNNTVYCYTRRTNTSAAENAKTWVYDALGHRRAQDFNADNQPKMGTSPTGTDGSADGSTVAEYSSNRTDQLNSLTEPKNDGSGKAEQTSMTYNDDSSNLPGANYLPLSKKGSDNSCNRYGYDSKGRTTATYTGLQADSNGSCPTSNSGAKESKTDYNSNGTISKSWDANVGSSPTDDDKTIYTYWKSTDTGFVAGTQDQVKTIRKPGGDCSTGSTRKLCTSFTYDRDARVLSETNGLGQTTAYAYDANDRTTRIYYNGATEASCLLLGIENCVLYDYDAYGNLVGRRYGSDVTSFTFDRVNRQTGQIVTPTVGGGADSVAMAYDAAGNMTGYSQTINGVSAPDVTTYAYDQANQPDTVTNSFGTIDISTDPDGRTSGIAWPSAAGYPGTKVSYDYTKNGRPDIFKWKDLANNQIGSWDYSYSKQITVLGVPITIDTPQLQKRDVDSAVSGFYDGTRDYTYNNDRNLTDVQDSDSGSTDYSYTYDDVGNILSETAGSTTTNYGYNRAGERCWKGSSAGTSAQKLSRSCPTGPAGSTAYSRDADGNNLGVSGDSLTYNTRSQVTSVDGQTQTFRDQGNDLRATSGAKRLINGPLGVTAIREGTQTLFVTRDPSGTILTMRPTTGTSFYFVTEPNGNVAYLSDPFGYAVGAYQYSPYGKTSMAGLGAANPFRYLGAWQDTTAASNPGHYKLGARYYDTTGMFTQPDPISGGIGDPRTLTRYNYAGGDPINASDPSGYFSIGNAVKSGLGKVGSLATVASGAVLLDSDPSLRQATNFLVSEGAGLVAGAACEGAFVFATGGIGALATGGCFAAGLAVSNTVASSLK